jgi:hypothetical protein
MFYSTQLQSPNEILWQIANHKLRHDLPPTTGAINDSIANRMVQSLIAMPIECRPGFPMRNTTMPPFSAGRETPPRDQTRAPDTRTAMYSEALLVAQLRLETTLQLVGYWLRAIREALGMTVRQFAKAAGTAPSTAQAAERAEARGDISLSTLTRYAEVLGCELRGSHPDRAGWPMCGPRLNIGHSRKR